MIQTEIERVALAVHGLRPDWPATSLRTFIENNLAGKPYRDVMVAFAWIACDPTTDNPGRILGAGPWWNATRAGVQHVTDLPPRFTPEPGPKRDPARRRELIDQFKQDLHRTKETK